MKKNKTRSIAIYTVAVLILAIPFVGMQFTNEINWDIFDFAVAGVLLFGAAFLIDFTLKKEIINRKKIFFVIIILLILFLVWAELAVGIFGTPFAGS